MMDRDKLQAAVDSKWVPVYASNYSQVKDALQDKHGQRGWIGALAQQLSGSEKRSGKEYLAARRSIERYETGQFKSMKKYSPEMAKVGKSLPPIGKALPNNQINITVNGKQYDGKGERERSFTVTFKGPDAYGFASSPTYQTFFKSGLGYPDGVIDRFEGGDSSALEVTSVV
jgi:hypothetical protein